MLPANSLLFFNLFPMSKWPKLSIKPINHLVCEQKRTKLLIFIIYLFFISPNTNFYYWKRKKLWSKLGNWDAKTHKNNHKYKLLSGLLLNIFLTGVSYFVSDQLTCFSAEWTLLFSRLCPTFFYFLSLFLDLKILLLV